MAIKKLTDYQAPVTVNPYIAELADIKVGDVFEETVNTTLSKDGEKVRGLDGMKQKIQAAARENGFTARILEEEVLSEPTADAVGEVRIVFKAAEVQKSGPRKPREGDKPAA